jgi:tRNA threonylcarbamoyladenosine biosynthesis protein TsaE
MKNTKTIQSNSVEETQKLAESLAKEIITEPSNKGAFIIALHGELGAGKTSFAQGVAKGLGIEERVLSPTFIVVKEFPISKKNSFSNLIHIDCYRLEKSKDLLDLGWSGMISDPSNIILVEWAEKVKDILPEDTRDIHLSFIDETTREIQLSD